MFADTLVQKLIYLRPYVFHITHHRGWEYCFMPILDPSVKCSYFNKNYVRIWWDNWIPARIETQCASLYSMIGAYWVPSSPKKASWPKNYGPLLFITVTRKRKVLIIYHLCLICTRNARRKACHRPSKIVQTLLGRLWADKLSKDVRYHCSFTNPHWKSPKTTRFRSSDIADQAAGPYPSVHEIGNILIKAKKKAYVMYGGAPSWWKQTSVKSFDPLTGRESPSFESSWVSWLFFY